MNSIRTAGMTVLAMCAFAANVAAQTLYRCGNSFQDKPCAAGQPGKIVSKDSAGRTGSASVSASASAAGPADAQCRQRGEAAKKIVWAREAGALEGQMLAKAQNDEERAMIQEVYRQRATAPEMKQIIEANCIKEKELVAQGHKPRSAVNAGMSQSVKQPKSATILNLDQPNQKNKGSDEDEEDEDEKKTKLNEAEKKKIMCAKLREEILHAISMQRRGGSHEEMEAHTKRKNALDSQFFRAGC
jgi:hypothetical protein